MNTDQMSTVAQFAIDLIKDLPMYVSAGIDISKAVNEGAAMLMAMRDDGNRGPTQGEYDQLRLLSLELHNQFQALGTGEGG